MTEKINDKMRNFLTHLANIQTNDGWILSKSLGLDEHPYFIRQQAQRLNYVDARGNNIHRQFKISSKGLEALGKEPAAAAAAPKTAKPQFNSAEILALEAMKERAEAKRELKLKALVAKMAKEAVDEALIARFGDKVTL